MYHRMHVPISVFVHAESLVKLVTEAAPILLDKDRKPFKSPIIRIENNLGRRCKLRGTIPAIAAMHKNR